MLENNPVGNVSGYSNIEKIAFYYYINVTKALRSCKMVVRGEKAGFARTNGKAIKRPAGNPYLDEKRPGWAGFYSNTIY